MDHEKTAKSVLIISADKKVPEYISGLLSPEDFSPIVSVCSIGEARKEISCSEFDIAIINTPLPDEFGTDFALDLTDGPMGILLICKNDMYEKLLSRVKDSGIMVLPRPLSRSVLYSAVMLMSAVNARFYRMEKQSRSLRGKMEDIRVVNRAKWLLIENLNMTEKDAHYYIERQAMDLRLSRRDVAEQIIRTYDK